MKLNLRWGWWGLIGLSFLASGWAYAMVPSRIAIHWDMQGVANGFAGKTFGLFFAPTLMLAVVLLLLGLMHITPLRKNLLEMHDKIDALLLWLTGFLTYVHGLSIAWNLGVRFNFGQFLVPALGVLFIALGTLIKDMKPNWVFGIRTPWTLSDETVWRETHTEGAKAFQFAGLLMFLGAFIPRGGFLIVLVAILGAAIYTVAYSYVAFAKRHPATRQ